MIKMINAESLERLLYASLLLLWISINISLNMQDLFYKGSFGIIYLWVFVFPALIFLSQLLFDSRAGWFISLCLFVLFVGYVGNAVSTDLLRLQAVQRPGYHLADYLSLITTGAILAGIAFLLLRIRPGRK